MSTQNPREKLTEQSISQNKTGNLIYIPKKPQLQKDKIRLDRNISPQLPPRYTDETPPILDINGDTMQNYIYDGDIEMMPDSDSESIFLGEHPIETSPDLEEVQRPNNESVNEQQQSLEGLN